MNKIVDLAKQKTPTGYQLAYVDDGVVTYSKKEESGYYSSISCSLEQLENGDLEYMVQQGLTLSEESIKKIQRKYRLNNK
mgnify:FL=1